MKRTNTDDAEILREIAKLRGMASAELVPKYEEAYGRPPRSRHKDWLWKRIVWKLQERRYGGLSTTAQHRLDELIGEIRLPVSPPPTVIRTAVARSPRGAHSTPAGTVITRTWHGRELVLTVFEDSVEVDGVPYGSLSAAAKAITGQHWNGRLFWFGRRPSIPGERS